MQEITGIWFNEHGSELRVDVDAQGMISGQFRSGSGLAKPSDTCAVVGFASRGLLAFAVDFGRFNSLTAWTGHYLQDASGGRIRACWHMTVGLPARSGDPELWKGVWTGEDEFRRERFGAAEVRTRGLASHPIGDWPDWP